MKLKPNEQVIKAGSGSLNNEKIKVIVTNQNRIYLNNLEFDKITEITYFNKNYFTKNGVHIITENNEVKFLIKNRKSWEKLFSKLY